MYPTDYGSRVIQKLCSQLQLFNISIYKEIINSLNSYDGLVPHKHHGLINLALKFICDSEGNIGGGPRHVWDVPHNVG